MRLKIIITSQSRSKMRVMWLSAAAPPRYCISLLLVQIRRGSSNVGGGMKKPNQPPRAVFETEEEVSKQMEKDGEKLRIFSHSIYSRPDVLTRSE